MWLLKKLTDDATIQYLISKKKSYTIGRKNSDIVLNDSSISRTHCIISLVPKRECPVTDNTPTRVSVIDKKSKYGTYIQRNYEWMRLDEEKDEELSDQTIIRFGLMGNIWRLEHKSIIVCTSRLSSGQIQEVKSQLNIVDGTLLNKWTNQCTVLIVNDITLTAKVLLALIHGVPIVTTNYLNQVIENVHQNQPLPDYKKYKPQISESTLVSHLVSVNPEDNRRELLKGKTFVIPTEEQLENLRPIIEAAGGCVQLLKIDSNWRKLSDENTILLQLPCNKIINPDQHAQDFKNLTNVLKNEYNVRVVPETEIYHAIAYSSLEKYCNPKCEAFELRHSSYKQNSCGDVIEEETPTQSHFQAQKQFQQPTTSGFTESELPQRSTLEEEVTPSKKRNRSPEVEKSLKKAALDAPPYHSYSISSRGDADMFCEDSNEQIKPNEVDKDGISNNFEDLRITKQNAVKDGNGVADNFCKRSSSKNSSINITYELGEFWDYNPKRITRESAKRKISRNSTEENQFDSPKKKKRIDNAKTTWNNTDLREKKIAKSGVEAPPFSLPNHPTMKLQSKPKYRSLRDTGNNSLWHQRKSTDEYCAESENSSEVVINVKRFKKKEVHIRQTVTPYSKEKIEEIGKILLMQGWHTSHCSRRKSFDT